MDKNENTFSEIWAESVDIPSLFRALVMFIFGVSAIIFSHYIIFENETARELTSVFIFLFYAGGSFASVYILFCLMRPKALIEGWRIHKACKN